MIDSTSPSIRRVMAPGVGSCARPDLGADAGAGERRLDDMARPVPRESASGRPTLPTGGKTQAKRCPAAGMPADAAVVAARAVLRWHRTEANLAPVIGHGGYIAIYGRSLTLTRATFPWLPATGDSTRGGTARARLHAALIRRTGHESSAADAALQLAFEDLLASLIGLSLARRLLAPPRRTGDAETEP